MSFIEKARHKAEEVIGEVKEKVGGLTNNDRLTTEGKQDQAGARVKQAGDSVKDAASKVTDTFRRDEH